MHVRVGVLWYRK